MIKEPRSPGRVRRTAIARTVRDALRGHLAIEDLVFDQLYPDHIARLSRVHWTPVAVALRAAELLAPEPGMRVLDIGAGPGKLCCVGALARGGTWRGIESNPALVAVATATARSLELGRSTSFRAGDLNQLDWGPFDSLYLYNPFESLLFGDPGGSQIEASFAEQVARTEQRLSELPAGIRVVTFHGFGGVMPSSFAIGAAETFGSGTLALWIKQPAMRPGIARR